MDGIEQLREAIRTVPIPGAPPSLPDDAALVGLSFMDAALRQNHIRRLTERIHLTEHGAARRVTEVDISLSMLTQEQIRASEQFAEWRRRGEVGVQQKLAPTDLWVPVARVSRRSVSPIDVTDAAGDRRPRLTQFETSRLLAAALYRLFRSILKSHPQSRVDGLLGQFLYKVDESRWLTQVALTTLLLDRTRPHRDSVRVAASGTVPGHGAQYRELAIEVLDSFASELLEFTALLDVAVREYLLVVALDNAKDEHILRYESPLSIQTQGETIGTRARQALAHATRRPAEYRIEYQTEVPSTLRAYHLVAEVDPDVAIAAMAVTTTADRHSGLATANDLRHLAGLVDDAAVQPATGYHVKIVELELQAALRSVSELYRRRTWEAGEAGVEVDVDGTKNVAVLARAATAGEATIGPDGILRNSLLHHPDVTSATLSSAASEIHAKHLFVDFGLENDPAQSTAHVYWRRSGQHGTTESVMSIAASLVMRPTGSIRPRLVTLYAAAVCVLSYVVGSLLCRVPLPLRLSDADAGAASDAVVAVLLLVPGFLFTRLDLPKPNSISGYMRLPLRLAADGCIAVATLESAVVAAGIQGLPLGLTFVVATIATALIAAWIKRAESMPEDEAVLPSATLPKWVARPSAAAADVPSEMVLRSSGVADA